MSNVKRFTYVQAPRGSIVHVTYRGLVEGNRTVCGRMLTTQWTWRRSAIRNWLKNRKHCKQCGR